MKTSRKIKSYVTFLSILVFVLFIVKFILDSRIKISYEGEELTNLVDQAKSIERDKFYLYDVVPKSERSKEHILVEFNTESNIKLGVIDEFGNVIREPKLDASPLLDTQYACRYGPNIYSPLFEGKFSILRDKLVQQLFDYELNEVFVSQEEFDLYEKREFEYFWSENEKVADSQYERLSIILEENFEIGKDDFQVSVDGDYYAVTFSPGFAGGSYYLLFDKNLNLMGNSYFKQSDNSLYYSPNKGSVVGSAVIWDFGRIYFNVETGKIIWITYVDGCN